MLKQFESCIIMAASFYLLDPILQREREEEEEEEEEKEEKEEEEGED